MRALWVLLLGLIGCGSPAGPPVIRWGEEICDRCHMLISDPRFAGALRLADGTTRQYDDIGCLARDLTEGDLQAKEIWLRAYDRDQWLEGETAWLVQSQRIASPMGFGVAAFGGKDSARTHSQRWSGSVISFAQWLESFQPRAPKGKQSGKTFESNEDQTDQ